MAGAFYFMTERQINQALKQIAKCKTQGYFIEALVLSYQLNFSMVCFLVKTMSPAMALQDKKMKLIVNMLLEQDGVDWESQGVITKRSLKTVKVWFEKMDLFFRSLKLGQLSKPNALQLQAEQIFGILNISANKLFAKNKR